MPHNYSPPSDYVTCHTAQRANLVADADLVGGATRVWFDYAGQDYADTFSSGDAAEGQRYLERGPIYWTNVGVSSGRAYTSVVSTLAVAPFNAFKRADVDLSFSVSATRIAGICIRGQSENNGWFIGANFTTGKVFAAFRSQFAGGFAAPAWESAAILTPGSTVTIRVVASGPNFTIYANGQVGSFTSTDMQTEGIIYLRSSTSTTATPNLTFDSTARWDNFSMAASTQVPATSYMLRNLDGDVLASGQLNQSVGYIDIPDSILRWRGLGPYGWYRITLHGPNRGGNYGTSYGGCHFVRYPTRAGMLANAARTVALGSSTGWDPRIRSMFAIGPTRLALNCTASNLTTANATSLADAQFLKANYVDAGHASRPRHIIGHFNNGTVGYEANVTTVVSMFKDYVDAWEPRNEPNLNTTAADFVTEQAAFKAAVKAGDPNAIVLGPNPVSFVGDTTRSWLWTFLGNGGKNHIDALSVHSYNAQNGSIATTRASLAELRSVLSDHGISNINVWQTEQGADTTYGYVYQSYSAARWWVSKVVTAEVVGLYPIERNSSWYDVEHGYGSVAHYLLSEAGPEAALPMLGTAVAEIGNRTLTSELDFGAAKIMYCGGVWSGADGSKTIMVLADSDVTQPIRFRVSGASTITAVDSFGNTSTLTPSGEVLTVTPTEFPTWLRIPNGVTCTFVATDWQFGSQLTVASPTSSRASAVNVNRVADGTAQDPYAQGTDPFYDFSGNFPHTVTMPLSSATVDRVIVYGMYNINDRSQLTDFDVHYTTDNATWTLVATVKPERSTSVEFTSSNGDLGCVFETHYRGRQCWDFKLPTGPVAGVKAIRITVRDVSYGMYEDPRHVVKTFGNEGWSGAATGREPQWRRLYIRDVVILGPPTTRPLTTQEKRRQRRRLSFRFR